MTDRPDEDADDGMITIERAMEEAFAMITANRLADATELMRRIVEAEPDYPQALNTLGILSHSQVGPQEAIGYFRRAVAAAPDHSGYLNNLGNALLETGQVAEGVDCYQRGYEINPDDPDILNNLATVFRVRREFTGAETLLRRAIEQRPQFGGAHQNLAQVLYQTGRHRESLEHFWQAQRNLPSSSFSRHHLALAYWMCGEPDNARAIIRDWLEAEPDNIEARHYLSSFGSAEAPARASDAYVAKVFDRFAESFDAKLGFLGYRAPEYVAAALGLAAGDADGSLDILDAGVGTGLCGPLVKPFAKRLDGVDLSPKMMERARDRGCYDQLEVGELTAFLQACDAEYDVVISADTLCYFGVLEAVSAAAAGALKPKGVFIFSVEALADDAPQPVKLEVSGRYAHRADYIRQCLEAAGLTVERMQGETLRSENALPVHGHVVTARKPA